MVVREAIHQWQAVNEEAQVELLKSVQFQLVDDLPGNGLAWSIGDGNVLVDRNAAGHGWFVDGTPHESGEYQVADGAMIAAADSPANKLMDLLTVVMHEIGHILGYEHGDDELMGATLSASERRSEDQALSQREKDLVTDPSGRKDGAQISSDKRSVDDNAVDLDFHALLGWSSSWTEDRVGAVYPGVAFDDLDEEQLIGHGRKKKRFDGVTNESTAEKPSNRIVIEPHPHALCDGGQRDYPGRPLLKTAKS